MRFAIRRLRRKGYHVLAYETTAAVFYEADPLILPELISQVREDIRSRIAKLASEGVTEFGFFGSSLGSFILYNCIGREIPELRWGVFNTGGNIARGLWNYPELRQLHVARGWSLARLEEAWAELQWPDFGRLDGCRFVFASSRGDTIAPLSDISRYIEPMLRAGADISVHKVRATSHRTTVIVGLWKGPQLVRMVRTPSYDILRGGRGTADSHDYLPTVPRPARRWHPALPVRRRSAYLLTAVRASYGAALLWSPGALTQAAAGHPGGRGIRTTARVLGFRQLVQAGITGGDPSARALMVGAATDATHAASMVALAVTDSRSRRAAVLDALAASSLAALGLHAARQARPGT